MPTRIAVQGIEGSFSEQAAIEFTKKVKINEYTLSYEVSSSNVLQSLTNKTCDYGICALENSTGGVVFETIEALCRHTCEINLYFSIPVHQTLLANKGMEKSKIREIYSHTQALSQCKQYLQHNFPNVKLIETEDTALSAKHLHQGSLPANSAVICNQSCAELYDLAIIEENINDLDDNQTLFIALTTIKEST